MPKKTKEPLPTERELEATLQSLYYVGVQCATWHLLQTAIESVRAGDESLANMMHNSLVESALLFVRKTVEFFKPEEDNDWSDNIYAYHYCGYTGSEWLLDRDKGYADLHKRVGHVSVAEVRYGKLDWPLDRWVMLCLDKWIEFFDEVSTIPSALNPKRATQCRKNTKRLRDVKSRVNAESDFNRTATS